MLYPKDRNRNIEESFKNKGELEALLVLKINPPKKKSRSRLSYEISKLKINLKKNYGLVDKERGQIPDLIYLEKYSA